MFYKLVLVQAAALGPEIVFIILPFVDFLTICRLTRPICRLALGCLTLSHLTLGRLTLNRLALCR